MEIAFIGHRQTQFSRPDAAIYIRTARKLTRKQIQPRQDIILTLHMLK